MIIGTAGHIDHGKSALVEALTGQSMDPLAEERRRGITLDLHFAPLSLGDGAVAGVVDVPGHEDLIRSMVAGAAGLDLVLLVVAADEGIMPQTREHLAILEQLRIPAGIPVITKADLVEPEWLAMVESEVAGWLGSSAVSFTPPVAVSVRTGQGLESLRAMLAGARPRCAGRGSSADLFRLPIDRAFSLPGAGTVVTGTSWSGRLAVGERVRILPAGIEGRVRSLERHGSAVSEGTPGDRIAVALAGVEREAVRRGAVLVAVESPWESTRAVDVRLELLSSAPRALGAHTRVRLHLGTIEALARVQLSSPIPPGGSGFARIALEEPIIARGGDRLVLRSYSPVTTIGGGEIVDPLPPLGRAQWDEALVSREPVSRLSALLTRRSGAVQVALLPVLLGVSPQTASELSADRTFIVRDGWILLESRVRTAMNRLREAVAEHHRTHPADPGMSLETLRAGKEAVALAGLDRLADAGTLVIAAGVVREPGFRPSATGGDAMIERIILRIEAGGLGPPSMAELQAELQLPGLPDAVRLATRTGRIVAVERDRHYGQRALAGFKELLAALAARGPITPPAVREAAGISRKYLIPLLEWADRTGLTIRDGDVRHAGPALHPTPTHSEAAGSEASPVEPGSG